MASGGRHGFAQSLFQVGGNTGSAIGPLLAAFIVLPHGQGSIAWFSLAALLAHRRAAGESAAGTGASTARLAARAGAQVIAHAIVAAARSAGASASWSR